MKLFTALAALTFIAAPVQAGYVTCETTRSGGDGSSWIFNYATNEEQSTLSETIPSTGRTETLRAVYSADAIVAPMSVAGFSGQIQLDRSTGEITRTLAGTDYSGTCKPAAAPIQLF